LCQAQYVAALTTARKRKEELDAQVWPFFSSFKKKKNRYLCVFFIAIAFCWRCLGYSLVP
jgi:hypothetical protein